MFFFFNFSTHAGRAEFSALFIVCWRRAKPNRAQTLSMYSLVMIRPTIAWWRVSTSSIVIADRKEFFKNQTISILHLNAQILLDNYSSSRSFHSSEFSFIGILFVFDGKLLDWFTSHDETSHKTKESLLSKICDFNHKRDRDAWILRYHDVHCKFAFTPECVSSSVKRENFRVRQTLMKKADLSTL